MRSTERKKTRRGPSRGGGRARAARIFCVTLGCAKNRVDAEIWLGDLLAAGCALVDDPALADVVLVNTCGFLAASRGEARRTLAALVKARGRDPSPRIAALGCWAEIDAAAIRRQVPGVDAVWGLAARGRLVEACNALLAGDDFAPPPEDNKTVFDGPRLLTTPGSYAYLRLSDGCDNHCAYCAIPRIRGSYRERTPEAILNEARQLADAGVAEVTLIAQDTTRYAQDEVVSGDPRRRSRCALGGSSSTTTSPPVYRGAGRIRGLAGLLEALLKKVDVERLRLLYAHPRHLDADVIALLKSEPRLCGYVDLPLQHTDDAMLARMNRGYGRAKIDELLAALSDGGRRMTLRTTLLAGFPGESEAAFERMLAFVRKGHFQHLGAFAWSPEKGTAAMALDGRVPAVEARRRRDALMAAQQGVAFAWLDGRAGGVERVVLDGPGRRGEWIGRTRREAPDGDGVVRVAGLGEAAAVGSGFDACLVRRDGYDMKARATAE